MTRQPTAITRVTEFWMSIDRRGVDECWPWTGYLNEDGYGEFFFEERMIGAHELAVTFTTGERRLPKLDTCHSCGNPPCCNPKHLRFGTRQSNVDDMVRMGRQAKPNQRLSDETVRLIRERRQAGASQDDLAGQYGISSSYVSMIVNGLKRPDAGGPIISSRQHKGRAA
jgi:hypothetical protein